MYGKLELRWRLASKELYPHMHALVTFTVNLFSDEQWLRSEALHGVNR